MKSAIQYFLFFRGDFESKANRGHFGSGTIIFFDGNFCQQNQLHRCCLCEIYRSCWCQSCARVDQSSKFFLPFLYSFSHYLSNSLQTSSWMNYLDSAHYSWSLFKSKKILDSSKLFWTCPKYIFNLHISSSKSNIQQRTCSTLKTYFGPYKTI